MQKLRNMTLAFFLIFVFIVSCSNKNAELIEAIKQGDSAKVTELIQAGADVNAEDEDGDTAIMIASQSNHQDIIRLLIQKGAIIDENIKNTNPAAFEYISSLLIAAAKECKIEKLQLLIEQGASVNSKDEDTRTALMYAVECGYIEMINILIREGADVNAKDRKGITCLMLAAQQGNLEIVNTLIRAGVYLDAISASGNSAADYARDNGYDDVFRLLLSLGAEAKINHELIAAVIDGDINKVQQLLDQGAYVNAKDSGIGNTPLIYAAGNGYTRIAQLLINAGADVNIKSETYRTALMWAAYYGSTKIARMLIQAGADVNITDIHWRTALYYARKHGFYDIADLLLEAGAQEQ